MASSGEVTNRRVHQSHGERLEVTQVKSSVPSEATTGYTQGTNPPSRDLGSHQEERELFKVRRSFVIQRERLSKIGHTEEKSLFWHASSLHEVAGLLLRTLVAAAQP